MGKTGSMPSNLERFGNRTQVLQANTAGMYIYANVKIQAFSVFKKKKNYYIAIIWNFWK